MNHADALAHLFRTRRAYHAALAAFEATGSRQLSKQAIQDRAASRTALAAAAAAYDAAITELEDRNTGRDRLRAAEAQWRRAAHDYDLQRNRQTYQRLGAAHAAYQRLQQQEGV